MFHPDFATTSRRFVAPLICLALLLLTGCAGGRAVAQSTERFPQKTGFIQRQINVNGQTRTSWVFLPPDYSPYKTYPAILFLHGLFEQGNGGTSALSAGLGPIIGRNPAAWPFITIFPQSDGDWKGADHERLALAALDDAQHQYAIDPDRVILAGLSYGGLGVWEIGARNRDRFAACVPVSGFEATELAGAFSFMPVWAFASRNDPFVSSSNSKEMCRLIQDKGGRPNFTEFDGDSHDCWADAIDRSELVHWMLVQRRDPLQTASRTRGSRTQAVGRLRSVDDR